MKKGDRFKYPDEVDLLGFFSSEPVERIPEEGYWLYESADARGVKLRFSFNALERSVQTVIMFDSKVITTVSYEGAGTLKLDGNALSCDFEFEDSIGHLCVLLVPYITISWSTLRTR
jgi:hypothetical protein